MFLEIGLIGLLSISPQNLIGNKPPDIARPFFNVGIENFSAGYEGEVEKGSTVRYKFGAEYKVFDSIAVGYETRKFGDGYGNNGDYITLKVSYRFDK